MDETRIGTVRAAIAEGRVFLPLRDADVERLLEIPEPSPYGPAGALRYALAGLRRV